MRCAPYFPYSCLYHVLFRPHGFAKASAQQPAGLLGLLIPLLFLAAVRRFLKESYTDIGLLPAYDGVDVSVLAVCSQSISLERFHAICPSFVAALPRHLPPVGEG